MSDSTDESTARPFYRFLAGIMAACGGWVCYLAAPDFWQKRDARSTFFLANGFIGLCAFGCIAATGKWIWKLKRTRP